MNKRSGFTLVEVTIAMAIGALIVVIAFTGINQAQKASRDSNRKTDAARYLSAAKQWVFDHNGVLPASSDATKTGSIMINYITTGGAAFKQPGGSDWDPQWVGAGTDAATALVPMKISAPAACTGNTLQVLTPPSRQIAVSVYQETTGSVCLTSQ